MYKTQRTFLVINFALLHIFVTVIADFGLTTILQVHIISVTFYFQVMRSVPSLAGLAFSSLLPSNSRTPANLSIQLDAY